MKRLSKLLLVLVLIGGSLAPLRLAQANDDCQKINAKGKGQINFTTNSSIGQILGGGRLHGTTEGLFTFTGVDTYEGTFRITTKHGTLTLHMFEGRFNTQTGLFSNDSRVVAGTGKWEDATGGLFFEGSVAPDGRYTDTIRGEVCLD
jgi:hypothetical protein